MSGLDPSCLTKRLIAITGFSYHLSFDDHKATLHTIHEMSIKISKL